MLQSPGGPEWRKDTIGRMQGRASVMVKDDMMTGWKSRILGYMSSGESVPDVITTDWNRLNTGLMAIDESKQLPQQFNRFSATKGPICFLLSF